MVQPLAAASQVFQRIGYARLPLPTVPIAAAGQRCGGLDVMSMCGTHMVVWCAASPPHTRRHVRSRAQSCGGQRVTGGTQHGGRQVAAEPHERAEQPLQTRRQRQRTQVVPPLSVHLSPTARRRL